MACKARLRASTHPPGPACNPTRSRGATQCAQCGAGHSLRVCQVCAGSRRCAPAGRAEEKRKNGKDSGTSPRATSCKLDYTRLLGGRGGRPGGGTRGHTRQAARMRGQQTCRQVGHRRRAGRHGHGPNSCADAGLDAVGRAHQGLRGRRRQRLPSLHVHHTLQAGCRWAHRQAGRQLVTACVGRLRPHAAGPAPEISGRPGQQRY